MKFTLSNVFIFAAGASIGSAVTWKILKTKYEQLAKEEIESVKEVFSRRNEVDRDVEIDDDSEYIVYEESDAVSDELKKAVDEIAHSEGYTNYSDLIKNKKTSEVKPVSNKKKPYVISPDEFDELDGYEVISLTYFADGVLTDDHNEPVEDVEGTVGRDSLNTFGDYEPDSVFVRNEELRVDYEILADVRKYSDVVGSDPHRAEGS